MPRTCRYLATTTHEHGNEIGSLIRVFVFSSRCYDTDPMETPLTPLEFARRARRLYGSREAVIDGSLRLTYEQFFTRADRWSEALQRLGVGAGDRVAYIAPNTHRQLES